MKKGQNYGYNSIEEYAIKNDYSIIQHSFAEHQRSVVGKCFIVLEHNEKDITISFVLEGATANEYFYDCVYSDIK